MKADRWVIPALLISTSTPPNRSMTVAIADSHATGSVRSHTADSAPGNWSATVARRSGSMSMSTSRAPSRAKRPAMALPSPPAAPVTTTTASVKSRLVTAPLEEGGERLLARLLRCVPELLFEPTVRQHRTVAKEVDLLGTVLGHAEPFHPAERSPDRTGGNFEIALAHRRRDRSERYRPVTGKVVDTDGVRLDPAAKTRHHITVPDEYEGGC